MIKEERALLVWPIMFFARRVAFIVLVLYFRENIWAQLAVQNFVSLGLCIYLQWYMPFEEKFNNHIETFNEATVLCLTYCLFCFTDFVPEAENLNELGHAYNCIFYVNLAVHAFIMLRSALCRTILYCKTRFQARKAA